MPPAEAFGVASQEAMRAGLQQTIENLDDTAVDSQGDVVSVSESTSSGEMSPTPPLKWEVAKNGENKFAHIITTLPTEAFRTFTFVPNDAVLAFNKPEVDQTLTEAGKKKYELGIDPEKLGELPAGAYRIRYGKNGDVDIEVVEDDDRNKFFSIKVHINEDLVASDAEYLALADGKPEEVSSPFQDTEYRYFSALSDYCRNLIAGDLPPIIRAFYKKIGFKEHEVDGRVRLLPPTPQTFKKLAEAKGLPIRFIGTDESGKAQIPAMPYQESFEAEEYPIDIGELIYYLHDIQNDHLPGAFPGHNLEGSASAEDQSEPTLLSMLAPLIGKITADGSSRGVRQLDNITLYTRDMISRFDDVGIENLLHAMNQHSSGVTWEYDTLGHTAGVKVNFNAFKRMLYRQVAKHARNLRGEDSDVIAKAALLEKRADNEEKWEREAEARRKNAPVNSTEELVV